MVVRVGKIGAMGGMEGEEAEDGEEEVGEEDIGAEDTEMPYCGDDVKKRGDDQMKPGLMAVTIYLQLFRVLYDTLLGWRPWRGEEHRSKGWALLYIHTYFAHTVCIEGTAS